MVSWIRSVRIKICFHMSNSISPWDSKEAFYAIHSRWLCPNLIHATTLEAEVALWTLTYDGEERAWNWEKYAACNVKYQIILGNLMEYGYQGLDPVLKVGYLLNGIRCNKLSTAVATVRAHPDRYKKDFDAVVAFLSKNIDKKAPTPSVKVASVTQTRPAKRQRTSTRHGTFRVKIELRKYSQEEYDSM